MAWPEDRCPFPRPFPPGFSGCAAYLPRLHFASDTRGQRLKPHWTCAHLETGQREQGGFYGQCMLGAMTDRERWAQAMESSQIAAIREARIRLSEAIRPQVERLMQVVAGKDGTFYRQAILATQRRELDPAAADLSRAFQAFVGGHEDLFKAAAIDTPLLLQCFAEGLREFVDRPLVKEWRFDARIVARYPWPITAFLRPDLVREVGLRRHE